MGFTLPKENRRRREKIFELFAIGVMLCMCVREEEDNYWRGKEGREVRVVLTIGLWGTYCVELYVFIFGMPTYFSALSNFALSFREH